VDLADHKPTMLFNTKAEVLILTATTKSSQPFVARLGTVKASSQSNLAERTCILIWKGLMAPAYLGGLDGHCENLCNALRARKFRA